MSYESRKHGTEHYSSDEVDVFGADGKRIPDAQAVSIRAKAVREREKRHQRQATDETEGR